MIIKNISPKILCYLAGALVVLFFLYFALSSSFDNANTKKYVVVKKHYRDVLTLTGTLEAKDEHSITVQTYGMITEIAENMEECKKGDVVVRLDVSDVNLQIARCKEDLELAESRLALGLVRKPSKIDSATFNVQKKRLALELDEFRLAELEKGTDEVKITNGLVELEIAKRLIKNRKEELAILKKLAEDGYVSQEDVSSAELSLKVAINNGENSQISLSRLEEGATKSELEDKRISVEMARMAVEVALKAQESVKVEQETIIRSLEIAVKRAKEKLKKEENELEKHILTSPIDGVVAVKWKWGYPWLKGRRIWKGCPVLSISDMSGMKVVVRVDESKIARVVVGQRAEISAYSIAGVVFSGTVKKVGELGKDAFAHLDRATRDIYGDAKTKVFEVDIWIDEFDERLNSGLGAQVKLNVADTPDSIVVPRAFVKIDSSSNATVRMSREGRSVEVVPVTIGHSGSFDLLLSEGVKEGDVLVFTSGDVE